VGGRIAGAVVTGPAIAGLACAVALAAAPAGAETLRDALLRAYEGNPSITGQRAAQRALDESVPIARAPGLPSVNTSTGLVQQVYNTAGANTFSPDRQATGDVQLAVPIFQAGAVKNAVRAAEVRVEAGRARLRGTEADLFTAVVAAYMDVVRDEAIVGLNTQNVRVLQINLDASKDRFQVGDLTRTDVAQSEARLAQARARLQQAEAQLIASREGYVRVVGSPADRLADPPALPKLPATPEEAVEVAVAGNPQLQAAARDRDATRYDIGVARAQRLPSVSAVLGGSYYNNLGTLRNPVGPRVGQDGFGANAGLSLNLPLFQGGRPAALVRQAEARRAQAIENVTLAERAVVAQARSALAIYRSSQQVIQSSEVAVEANKLSLEGVRAENSVGTRTILDILNAEQELLNSQVLLVTARRDAYVAGFALLAALGRAEARDLGLDAGPQGGRLYDPDVNYRRVRGRFLDYGSDGEPVPVATSTARTPAQGAAVQQPPKDPLLNGAVDRTPALTTGERAINR